MKKKQFFSLFAFLMFLFAVQLKAAELPFSTTIEKGEVELFNESKTGKVKVSWYGVPFHGRKTASGKRYNMNALTAAHKTLPFGTKVKITNPKNGKSVVVTVNDRGPYIKGRTFDLSRAAFGKIANINQGVLRVEYEIL